MVLYKFTTPDGMTQRGQTYPFPTQSADGSWKPGEWTEPIDGALPLDSQDKDVEGANRLRLMKHIDALWAPPNWICWEAEGEGIIGEDNEEISVRMARLLKPVDILTLLKTEKGLNSNITVFGGFLTRVKMRRRNIEEVNLWRANLMRIGGNFKETKLGIINRLKYILGII